MAGQDIIYNDTTGNVRASVNGTSVGPYDPHEDEKEDSETLTISKSNYDLES